MKKISNLEKLKARPTDSYKNFIEQIRFPLFKKLRENTTITFTFPYTVLVGANGCGKSSVLQALYGCPQGQSTGDFWFTTSIDPIKESTKGEPYRYIYSYKVKELKKSVSVIKTRAKRAGNLDYWETSKPRRRDGLDSLPEDISAKEAKYRNKTRWNPVEKSVIFIDFKSEISAFDKFFYFGTFIERYTLKTKQDFLRYRGKQLKHCFDTGQDTSFHSHQSDFVTQLDKNALNWISMILGKSYKSATVVKHDFFNNDGLSIYFKQKGLQYSEAAAGSGEVAIVSCVLQVLSAEKGALVLLDEPEVSLHPGAQNSLKEFLFQMSLEKELQIVLCTHSPYFVENLPPNAVKVFHQSDDGFMDVIDAAMPDQAFVRIGNSLVAQKIVFVEDELQMHMFKRAVRLIDDKLLELLDIKVHPGGASSIKSNQINQILVSDSEDICCFLDGDEKHDDFPIYSDNIPRANYPELKNIFEDYVGQAIAFPLNGGNADNAQEKEECYLRAIDIYSKQFFFANTQTPEHLLLFTLDEFGDFSEEDEVDSETAKQEMKQYAVTHFDEPEVSALDILNAQRGLLSKVPKENPLWLEYVERVREVLVYLKLGQ